MSKQTGLKTFFYPFVVFYLVLSWARCDLLSCLPALFTSLCFPTSTISHLFDSSSNIDFWWCQQGQVYGWSSTWMITSQTGLMCHPTVNLQTSCVIAEGLDPARSMSGHFTDFFVFIFYCQYWRVVRPVWLGAISWGFCSFVYGGLAILLFNRWKEKSGTE